MSDPEPDSGPAEPGQRCAIVAVIGATNAGKSTLVNTLVGSKVTIVSRKVQTTRSLVRGIVIAGASQLVLVDTPGIFAPKRRLDRAMVGAAWSGASDADAVLLVVDAASGLDEDVERIVAGLAGVKAPRILVLNKVDRVVDKSKLLDLSARLSAACPFERIYMISALSGDGVGDLKDFLAEKAPEGPWLYPADELSDLPVRLLAAEITREKIYHYLHDELPYSTAVETTQWSERRDGSVRIEQTIYVARAGQKGIVLGKGGETIKRISSSARVEIAAIVERPVHLFLFVKVQEGWDTDPERYREWGLDFPKE